MHTFSGAKRQEASVSLITLQVISKRSLVFLYTYLNGHRRLSDTTSAHYDEMVGAGGLSLRVFISAI